MSTYQANIKKYQRRLVVIDVVVYSVSAAVAGTGIILSAITMMAPVAVTIAVCATTSVAGALNIIAKKKISLCTSEKLTSYVDKLNTVIIAYTKLSSLLSESLNDGVISDHEFTAMVKIYNYVEVTDNNNVRAGTDRNKHEPAQNNGDISKLN